MTENNLQERHNLKNTIDYVIYQSILLAGTMFVSKKNSGRSSPACRSAYAITLPRY